ncbi:unnamed protein product [Rhizophagus irregularis]|nr:unnamed protein product [Rhizophagus irregularis]
MFMNLNDILDHVAKSVSADWNSFWISWTLGFLYTPDFKGFPDFLYIRTLKGCWDFCTCRTFKGTPGFCTHWTFKGT